MEAPAGYIIGKCPVDDIHECLRSHPQYVSKEPCKIAYQGSSYQSVNIYLNLFPK